MGPTIRDALLNLSLAAVDLRPEERRLFAEVIGITPPTYRTAVVAALNAAQGWLDERVSNSLVANVEEVYDGIPDPAEREHVFTLLWEVLVGEMSTADRRRLIHELTAE
jgi:hypothetical protein